MKHTLSIVIPNYNGAKLLEKNIPRLVDAASKELHTPQTIILVDDGSTDNSIVIMESLKKRFKIDVIIKSQNEGFSSTINTGVAHADTDLVLLLNSDAYPEKGFLDNALSYFKDKQVFGVGLMDKSIEEDKIVMRGRGIGYWDRGLVQHKRGETNINTTFWLSGGSSIIRKSVWQKLNGLNEIFNPFYWEDIDISYRAQKAGYKLVFEQKSAVVHVHEEGAIKKAFSGSEIMTIAFRNQLLFVWINISSKYLLFQHFLWLPFHLFRPLLSGNTKYIKGFFMALKRYAKYKKLKDMQKAKYVETDEKLLNLQNDT